MRKQLDPCPEELGGVWEGWSRHQDLQPGPPKQGLWPPAHISQYLLTGPLEAALILGFLVPVAATERRHGPGMEATPHWEGLRCGQAGSASDTSNQGGWTGTHPPPQPLCLDTLCPFAMWHFSQVSQTSQALSWHLWHMKCCSSCLEYSSSTSQLRRYLFQKV